MKQTFVFDSTPLMYLSKVKILEKLKNLSSTNLIPRPIYTEVVIQGKQQGYTDAEYVQKLIEEKVFQVVNCSTPLLSVAESKNISPADKSVLTLAQERRAVIITDDQELRLIANIERIENHGSLYLLMKLLRKKVLTKTDAKKAVQLMIKEGWHCSIETYTEIMKAFDEIQ